MLLLVLFFCHPSYSWFTSKSCSDYESIIDALEYDRNSCVYQLIEQDYYLNIQSDRTGNTALLETLYKNDFNNAIKLIEARANVNIQNYKGESPLIIATQKKEPKIVSLLLQYGAYPDLRDNMNKRAIDYSMEYAYERTGGGYYFQDSKREKIHNILLSYM